jgi:uncharacterized membrane protein YbhN (UPF0104 family)
MSGQPASGGTRRRVALLVRTGVTCTLLALLLWQVGTAELFARLRSVSLWALGASAIALAANVLIVAPRWAEILSVLEAPLPTRRLLRGVFVGFLLNQLLPTSVGGDIWRAWYARRLGAPLQAAIHSVIVDRAFGVLALALMLLAALPFDAVLTPAMRGTLYAASAAVFVAVAVAFFIQNLPAIGIPLLAPAQAALRELAASFTAALLAPRRNVRVVAYSIAGQAIPIVAVAILARSLGIAVPLIAIAIVTLAGMLLATIPLSLGGWGIREGAMVVLFGSYGIAADAALGVSLLFGACLTLAALPGLGLLLGKDSAPLDRKDPTAPAPDSHRP